MAWTDETKEEAIQKYLDAEPTPATSLEIVKEIATEYGESPNSLRALLTAQKKYVAKDPKAASAGTAAKASGDKAPRVSKEAAHAALTAAIEGAGKEADQEIISKLTGKAAQYFTTLFE